MESSNKVYGVTCNPYDITRTPGGSSGGTAVAIASDVGGSTRIPGFFCGLFGHKPTGRTIPNTGTRPPVVGDVEGICQLGPTARHAEDLWPLLQIMAGPDGVAEGV